VSDRVLEVIQAGLVPYRDALEWQRSLGQARIDGLLSHDVLLLLEHPPVITVGRNSRDAHLLGAGAGAGADGVEVFEVERGGDVTFHGPGQLVGYPILDLSRHRRDLHWYLRTLEQALIEALGELGVPAERNPGYTGVWTRGRKIASIGIHVKQWVTWHGFALNVTTDLSYFERIVPCGIPGVEMTSLERETGNGKRETGTSDRTVWDRTVAAVIRGFQNAFGVTPQNGFGVTPTTSTQRRFTECVQYRRSK
jgi:lipoyl(octanoyl) transferase